MVKIVTLAFSLFLAVVSAQSRFQQGQQRAQCELVNFKDKINDITMLNNVYRAAGSSAMVKNYIPMGPFLTQEQTLAPIPVSILGSNFIITPFIKTLNSTGFSNVAPSKFEVESEKTLKTGIEINNNVVITSKLSLQVQQINKKPWHTCWTSMMHPVRCPPTVLELDFAISITNPSISTKLDIEMRQCSRQAPPGTCQDLTVNDILAATFNQNLSNVLPRILHRLKSLSIKDVGLSFEKINYLDLKLHSSGTLNNELNKMWSTFTAGELNRKQGPLFDVFIAKSQNMLRDSGNKGIQAKLQPLFGDTCYDNFIKN